MNAKFSVALILLTAAAHAGADLGQETFRRAPFEAAVPLGDEGPPVVVQSNRVAFGASHEIKVFDVLRQEVIFTCSLVPGATSPSLAYETRPLGIFGNTVYAYVRHFTDPDRLDPGGEVGAVGCGAGGDPGEYEVVAVRIGEKEIRPIAHLKADVTLAEGLLNKSLPFVKENVLSLLSLETGAIRTMTLPGPTVTRPVVQNGELVGRYEGGMYWLTTNATAPRSLSFANTPLARLAEYAPFAKCGDLLIGCFVEDQVVACGLDGRLRWRAPVDAENITGSSKHVLILRSEKDDWATLCRLDPLNGALTWRQPVAPMVHLGGDRYKCGMELFDERIVFFNGSVIDVYDCATGRLLVNLPQKRRWVRGPYSEIAKLVRMAISENLLAIGYENGVFAVDITPTSEVAEKFRENDPANAWREMETLVESGPKASVSIEQIGEIGHNLADTPEKAPLIRSWLESVLREHPRDEEIVTLARAFRWIDNDALLVAATRVLRSNVDEWDKLFMLNIMACYPTPEKGLAALREVAAGKDRYPVVVRDKAAKWLRLAGERAEMSPDDSALIYSDDNAATVAAFARRLRETEVSGRAGLLKLIGMAADSVIVALADDLDKLPEGSLLDKLPEGDLENGLKLVSEARTRLEACRAVASGSDFVPTSAGPIDQRP